MDHLPGVPEERGVKLGNRISLWIEPISGYLVKLEERSEEYFYFDIKTGQKIAPYNQFLNVYTEEAFHEHIEKAKQVKYKVIIIQIVVPVILFLIFILLFLFYRYPRSFLFSREYALPLLFFISGIGITFSILSISQKNIENNETRDFSAQAMDITHNIKDRMDIYINVLAGGR